MRKRVPHTRFSLTHCLLTTDHWSFDRPGRACKGDLHRGASSLTTQVSVLNTAHYPPPIALTAQVKAACIVVLAANGDAARMIAKYRPAVPIIVGVVPRAARGRA
jgi:hypothetical protein